MGGNASTANKDKPPELSFTDSDSSSNGDHTPGALTPNEAASRMGDQQQPDASSSTERSPLYPLTEARFAYEKAVKRAMRMENALYEASEQKLNGITRQIDEERRRFEHPNRELFLRRRDEIYAINAMMRERERRRFEEYVLATQMSEERAAAMRLEEAAAPAAGLVGEGSSIGRGDSWQGDDRPDHWRQLRRMFSDVVQAIDRARPLTDAELDAMAKVAKEAARHSLAEEAARMALATMVDEVLDEALAEAAVDVGAEHVLTANGIDLDCGLPPSEVYKRAMDAAQREFDRATKAHQRSERARLAKEREELRAAALARKLGFERMLKEALPNSPQQKGRAAAGPESPLSKQASPSAKTASATPLGSALRGGSDSSALAC